MIVIKLGGSLMTDEASLAQCLNTVENIKEKVVIVPGGGVFADQVRASQQQWNFDEVTAHKMAILAMKQMALLYKSIKPSFVVIEDVSLIYQATMNHSAVIWSPDATVLNDSTIEASWNVTSDSLAAWLARQLNTDELILVKSADIPLDLTLQQMQDRGLVDRAFVNFTLNTNYNITLFTKHQFNEYFFT
ncbi:MAG: uridylate kinase [Methylococcales bacterium]|nr:uridylate kinase [Methylococcales bacterium]